MSTKFQRSVWAICRRIPRGKVSTYSEIARAIGNPKAVRAVGNALNKNPYSPEVPCHRVIRSDGTIGGFAQGTRKKIKMLQKEGVKINGNRVNLTNLFAFRRA